MRNVVTIMTSGGTLQSKADNWFIGFSCSVELFGFCLGALTHNVYSSRLLNKAISTYVLFLSQMSIMHMCVTF